MTDLKENLKEYLYVVLISPTCLKIYFKAERQLNQEKYQERHSFFCHFGHLQNMHEISNFRRSWRTCLLILFLKPQAISRNEHIKALTFLCMKSTQNRLLGGVTKTELEHLEYFHIYFLFKADNPHAFPQILFLKKDIFVV